MTLSPFQFLRGRRLPDSIYVEMVSDLFSVAPLVVVFALSQCLVGAAIFIETGDIVILGITILAVVVSVERIWMIQNYHRTAMQGSITRSEAAYWERRFAIRSMVTGALVGALGVRCFMLPYPTVQMLIVGMLTGYALGTITRVAYSPRLAFMNLIIVVVPPSIMSLMHGGLIYICLSLLVLIFLFGAFDVVRHSYDTTVNQLVLKKKFAGLAQSDALTGLTNRLGLDENLEAIIADAQRNGYGLAVHILDLDRFKAANDRYGHPAGDAILKEVARRLTRLTRESDLLVRLGGDEFVLVQTGVAARKQATALASRIVEDIGSSYEVKGLAIEIGTSVGIAIMSNEYLSPDELLARADQALYQAKRTRSGFIVYTTTPHLVPPLIDGDDFQDHDATTRKTANRR